MVSFACPFDQLVFLSKRPHAVKKHPDADGLYVEVSALTTILPFAECSPRPHS